MNARCKIFLSLALLFAVGVATGVMLAPHVRPHDKLKPFPADEWAATTVAEYQSRLELSADETAAVHAAARHAATEILRIRGETQENIRTTIKQMNAAVLPALDDTSRAALEQWLEEKRALLPSR